MLLSDWMASLDQAVAGQVDFLLPWFCVHGSEVRPQPLSYCAAVLRLRRLLDRFAVPDSNAYAMHSAKATLLSWATQVPGTVADSDRAKQGGHKESNTHSVQLYGRDDVFGALRLQEHLLRSLRKG